ncbi:MAG: TrmH family RNA methyltransferase [Parachlamydiaceae bacterium]
MITSLQNTKVKELIRLRDRRARDETGLFLIEGYRELLRFHETHHQAKALYYCPELFLGENEQSLIDGLQANGAELIPCSADVFRKISYRDRPDGLLGVAAQIKRGLKDLEKILLKDRPPFLVVAEAIEKPGNLGTILRSSDAAGADGLILCDRCTDLYNPNVVRASVGTLFTVPVFEATSEETIQFLKDHGISILAATPHATLEYTKADLKKPVALAIGTEQLGLSELWMNQADLRVKIPMCGVADSLNAAMATVILLYEVHRQRAC